MLIVGAKGFAKEVLEILHQLNQLDNLVFYDDVSSDLPALLYDKFPILTDLEEAKKYFAAISNQFTIGIGNPILRKRLFEKFTGIGGEFTSVISPFAQIGHYDNKIESGANIMTGTVITNDVSIGKGALINLNCSIGHNVIIGDFVEISPSVSVSGNCKIGNYSNLGTNATILPKVSIGTNVIVGAGSVVTKDIPDNCLVVGIPAVIKKVLQPIEF